MMLWIALLALTLAAAALVVLPFLRLRGGQRSGDGETAVLQEQIAEIDADERAGEIDAAGAETQRATVARQLFTATERSAPLAGRTTLALDRVAAASVASIVILGAALLYVATGAPNVPDAPALRAGGPSVQAAAGASPALPDVDTMITRLAARLKAAPQDAEGWRMLGWSYFSTQRYDDAVNAYRRAVALTPASGANAGALAEALIMKNGGHADDESRALLRTALAKDPGDERALFYSGLAKSQTGDARGALDVWLAALRRAQPDSIWAAQLRAHAISLAKEKGIDISARLPAGASDAGASPGSAAAADDQRAMIDGMVAGLEARLAQSPRDEDGWVRMMRSRMVLNQSDEAAAALQKALSAFADDAKAQARLRIAAKDLGVPGAS